MDQLRSSKNYGALAFVPMLVFLGLYVGCGVVFTILGVESPFGQLPRYVAVLCAICIALICYDRQTSFNDKTDIYARGAGDKGIQIVSLVILLAGGFQASAAAMGAESSIVNMGVDLIPAHLLIPGIFIIASVIATCTGTSMGTQVAMIPVAVAVAKGADLNVAMAGAAAIAGSYFGDNLSFISSTTIVATQGVGAKLKDKAKMNFFIALPAMLITLVLYTVLSGSDGSSVSTVVEQRDYSFINILPYLIVFGSAIAGVNVILVLLMGILATGFIGIGSGTIGFFEWTKAIGAGMENMFFLAVFSSLIAGLIELIKYYGGIEWLLTTLTNKIKGRKSCEYFISLITMAISGTTLNNTVAIIITAPIAKELGSSYKIAPKRLASLLDIFACAILGIVPHDSSVLLAQKYGDVSYIDLMQYSFYPFLLLLFTIITIQFGLLRTKEEKESAIV